MEQCELCAIRSKAVKTLTKEELVIHQEHCAEILLSPGEQIIREGLLSTHIAYLKSGLAKVHKKGIKGTDQILVLKVRFYCNSPSISSILSVGCRH